MEATKCVGKVMQDGHLAIPLNIFVDLGLTAGEEIEVRLKKLDGEKIAMRKRTADAQSYSFPEPKQKRLSELLFKNREGELAKLELLELERLVLEAQVKTLEKAKVLYEQKKEIAGAAL
jgi:hypothetical protein